MTANLAELETLARNIRGKVVELSHKAGTPHLGSALSCVDILVAAYSGVLAIDPKHPDDPNRDRLILSKGHAATALFATLAHRGFFPMALLDTFAESGSRLPEQPSPHGAPGVEWATAARYGSHGMKQRARAVEFHLSATRWVATGGGTGLSSRHGVRVANYLDPAKWGLDHSEVGAKFDRLVGRRLGPERAAALRVCLERDPSGTRARTLAEFLQGSREA